MKNTPWYGAASLPPWRAAGLTLAFTSLWVLFSLTPLAEWLNLRIETRLDFRLRQMVGLAPRLHPKLKIFAVDPAALAAGDLEYVPFSLWTSLLKSLGEMKPKAILVDKIHAPRTTDAAQLNLFLRGPHPYGGVTWSATEREDWTRLPNDCCGFTSVLGATKTGTTRKGSYLYGPSLSLLPGFKRLGHTGFRSDGYLDLVLRQPGDLLIPHWSVQFAEPLVWSHGRVLAAGKEIPRDRKGRSLPNYPKPEVTASTVHSLLPLLQRVLKQEPVTGIEEGDVVVIMNHASEGDLPTIESPVGTIPAFYASLAMTNDVLTGKFLKTVSLPELWIALGCFVGAWLGFVYSAAPLTSYMISALGLISLAGLLAFAFAGTLFPWLLTASGCGLCGTLVFLEKTRQQGRLLRKVRGSLEGCLPKPVLESILENPATLDLTPSTQIITVMCVDILGFSLNAERESPQGAFRVLRQSMEILTPILHRHGGILDRTTGDGIICFFGYRYGEGGKVDLNHAESAVRCALEMQRSLLAQNGRNFALGYAVYPLRIGVHTDRVHVGDAGATDRIEIAVLGSGVNFAQKLKAACEPYRVQISSSTRDRLHGLSTEMPGLHQKFVPAGDRDELFDAFEINPFFEAPVKLESSLDHYRKGAELTRLEARWPIDSVGWIFAECQWGKGDVINFSRGGLALRLPQYYGLGVTFNLKLNSGNGKLAEACREIGLPVLAAEVRWGKPDPSGYLHGIAFKNLSVEQKEKLFEAIHSLHLTQPVAKTHAA